MSLRRVTLVAALLAAATVAVASTAPRSRATPIATRPAELAGLYRIETPERLRPSARLRPPAAEMTFLRLYADGRSRLENVTVRDVGGSARPEVQVAPTHRNAWDVRTPSEQDAAGRLDRLCVEWVGALACDRFERDDATGDVTLFAGAGAGTAKLRLERVR
jgi:hypothetical protein